MKLAYFIIRDCGDGSQTTDWYKGSDFTTEQLYEAADNDKYDSYQSGDGVQITTLEFPDYFNLDDLKGITWGTTLPGVHEDEEF